MRNFAETKSVPEEIKLTDEEVNSLKYLTQEEAVRLAYAAGAEAMEKLDKDFQADEYDTTQNQVLGIAESISKCIEVLQGIHSICYARGSDHMITSCIDLATDNLNRVNENLCRFFNFELM